jgi:hypothetical protein
MTLQGLAADKGQPAVARFGSVLAEVLCNAALTVNAVRCGWSPIRWAAGTLMAQRLSRARMLVAIPALALALIPPLADLNETHVFNSLWSAHPRLHTVWLVSTNSILSLMALWILWRGQRAGTRESILTAAALISAVLAGFFVAAATQSAYGGALADPNGIPISFGALAANLVVFSILFVLVIFAVLIVRRPVA